MEAKDWGVYIRRRYGFGNGNSVTMALDKNLTYLATAIKGKYTVVSIPIGYRCSSRLRSMGIIEGVELEVLENSIHIPTVIKCRGATLSIGKGMAYKILVKRL